MVLKVTHVGWDTDEGYLIVYGDGDAKEGIAIPLGAMPMLNAEARRRLLGQQAKQHDQTQHGQYHFAELCTAQAYDVGLIETTHGEKVSLILDRGLETQIGFAIEPEHARELAYRLADEAARASRNPPTSN